MFYAIGSFLFALAFLAALFVIARDLFAYRGKMLAALGSLSLDRAGPPVAPRGGADGMLRIRPALQTRPDRRPRPAALL